MIKLRIYITGKDPKTKKDVEHIKHILEERVSGQYSLEVLDVLENSRQALEDNIFVTPTILRSSPLPQKKIIGDIRVTGRMLQLLLD